MGTLGADFPLEGLVEWIGDEAAMTYMRSALLGQVGANGQALVLETISEDALIAFGSPEGWGIVIIPPRDELESEDFPVELPETVAMAAPAAGNPVSTPTLDSASPEEKLRIAAQLRTARLG